MEALIIDFDSNNQEQESPEAFLTTFGSFTDDQAFNITTVLADRSFLYSIALENPSVTPIATPVRTHTPAGRLAEDAIYAGRKDVGLRSIPRKSVISIRRDSTTESPSFS